VERIGHIPADMLRVKRRSPIEAIGMRLATEAIRESLIPLASPGAAN